MVRHPKSTLANLIPSTIQYAILFSNATIAHITAKCSKIRLSSLESRRKVNLSCLAFKYFLGKLPVYRNKLLTPTTRSTYHLRSNSKRLFMVPRFSKVSTTSPSLTMHPKTGTIYRRLSQSPTV
ncbi:hypothetical protein FKM82_026156 [Ascaphus truei]